MDQVDKIPRQLTPSEIPTDLSEFQKTERRYTYFSTGEMKNAHFQLVTYM